MEQSFGRETVITDDLYETDFYTWTQRQASHLREGRYDLADLENLVEEIETLGRSEASALRSAYRLIVMHLRKLMIQREMATNSRRATIIRERDNVELIVRQSPGLKPRRQELFDQAYRTASKEAAAETGLSRHRFPVSPPFTVDAAELDSYSPNTTP